MDLKETLSRNPRPASVRPFGVKLTPMTRDEIVQLAEDTIASDEPCTIGLQNLHGLRVRETNPQLDQLHMRDDTYVQIDGMPLVWLCWLAGIKARRDHRVTWVDLIWPLLEAANRHRWNVFYIGSTPKTYSAALEKIRGRFPDLLISGCNGYDPNIFSKSIVEDIKRNRAQLVLVGMGLGRQEEWVLSVRDELPGVCIGVCGACMEYVAGTVGTPPRWLGRWGMEWLYRLLENPSRFGNRYLVEPWGVLFRLIVFHRANS